VEDDRAARRAITLILKKRGFAVSEAGTVGEAITALSADAPSWILLDLMLPDGNGIDVLHRVRGARMSSTVCVITGCGPDMVDEATQAGADHAFTKPLDVHRLMAVMTG
jgi:DNA-binding response OmpR family regulator